MRSLSSTSGEIDRPVPATSRILDYALGGGHNFEVDRDLWDRVEDPLTGAHLAARASRAFLRRAVGC